jgi:glycine/D-amino acid oxidase-like deaminating enzyme
MTSSLPTWTRADSVSRLDGDFDVLVVGGGITGSGAALDLAGRGLSVALVEQADFAQGTSSRSTKLFHGGIRYLPQFHFNLVSEGLREQKVLARIADFLYEPLEFVLPLYEQYAFADAPAWAAKGWKAPLALRAGLTLYDILGGVGRPGDHHRRVDADELQRLMPSVRPEGLKGGFVYSDAQTDDARLVVTVLKTAVRRYGAVAAGRMRVDTIEPLSTGFRAGVTDLESGEQVSVKARSVLAATGAFTPPGLTTGAPTIKRVMSKGTHLLVGADQLGLDGRALVLRQVPATVRNALGADHSLCLAEGSSRRCVDHPPYPGRSGRPDHVQRPFHIGGDHRRGVRHAHPVHPGHVIDQIDPVHGLVQRPALENVASDGMSAVRRQQFVGLAGAAQGADIGAVAHQMADQGAPHDAGAPRDEHRHVRWARSTGHCVRPPRTRRDTATQTRW